MLHDGLKLIFKQLVKISVIRFFFCQRINTLNEKLQLFQYLFQNLDILVINWLMQKVIQTETASNYQHEAFIQFSRNLKQCLVIILELKMVIFELVNHAHLLLIKEFPDFEDVFEVLSGHPIKVSFLDRQLLLILLF